MGRENELIQAVKSGDVVTVQKLLAKVRTPKTKLLGSTKRLNVNHQDVDGFSALHHAALSGNAELLLLLLETQPAVDIKDGNGMRPLHYAAWQGRPEPVRLLLRASASVNTASHDGQTPLHLAAQYGHYEVSETLLQHQANPCHVSKARKTPLDLACEFGRVKVVQLLLNSHLCVSLLEGISKDPTDPNFTTPLHLAAKNGHQEVIRLLLKSGIEINQVTKMGTALHEASLCGKTEVVKLLIENGVDVNIRNTYNQTALDIVNQFTTSHASMDIKQLLREASGILKVRALKDSWNSHDPTALNIRAGDLITVLEQHPDGRWKGHIHDAQRGTDRVGFFSPAIVEVISKRLGSTLSRNTIVPSHQRLAKTSLPLANQHISVPGTQLGNHLENIGAGDRHSVGSEGSVRSAGSGQSCEGNSLGISITEHSQTSHVGVGEAQSSRLLAGSAPGHLLHTVSGGEKDPEIYLQGKDAEQIFCWLRGFQLEMYVVNFLSAGYDLPTISRMTPEDLTAVGVTKPGHRKKISTEISRLAIDDGLPLHTPVDLWDWLSLLGLPDYHKQLSENGYESLSTVTELTWEGLQEIGIHRLGHQKKLLLGVKRLLDLQRGHPVEGTLRRRIHALQDIVTVMESPANGEPPVTPKLRTFQGLEMSKELQSALTRGGDTFCAGRRCYSQESISSRSQGSGHSQESATSHPAHKPQGLNTNLPERNLPEGTEQTSWILGAPNGSHTRAEPPVPPPKPSLKKRSLSACRYALSDGEPEEEEEKRPVAGSGALGSYATLTRRPGRCSLPNGQTEKKVLRSQSFAVRARKKGPPPPPPKRLSSMSSVDSSAAEGNCSVRSIAARLEELGVASDFRPGGIPQREDREVSGVRRRTVSESAAPLGGRLTVPVRKVEAEERKDEPSSSQHSSSESLPFAEEGNLTIKQRPKPPLPKSEHGGAMEVGPSLQPEVSPETKREPLVHSEVHHLPEPNAPPQTGPKPQIGPKPSAETKPSLAAAGPKPSVELDFNLTESDTVKRRPKAKEKETASPEERQLEMTSWTAVIPRASSEQETVTMSGQIERRSERGGEHAARLEVNPGVTGSPMSHLVLQKPSWGVASPISPADSIIWGNDSGLPSRKWNNIPPPGIVQQPEATRGSGPASSSELEPLTQNILDDISTMFDDLAEQLDAMLD